MTFKDSNWLMSIVLAHQPHFPNQPCRRAGVLGIFAVSGPDRQFRSEADGGVQWRGDSAGTLRPPAIRSGDRRISHLHSLQNALHHQHVHAARARRSAAAGACGLEESRRSSASLSKFPDDVVFTVEYSVRAAQMAVYELLSIDREIPPVTPHDKSLRVQLEALIKAFK